MTALNPWAARYVADLDAAAAALPADRRAELVAEVEAHLRHAMPATLTDDEARDVLHRLGDPRDLVEEAAADLPAPTPATSGSASEIVALLLMGIGGLALSLAA